MELYLSQEEKEQLDQIALRDGKANVGELLREVALRMLDQDRRFRAAVMEGIASAERGDFIEEEEMDARFAKMLES